MGSGKRWTESERTFLYKQHLESIDPSAQLPSATSSHTLILHMVTDTMGDACH